MTSTPPKLFDAQALRAHRARADLAHAGFLHDEAMIEVQERLRDVNRAFKNPAIVTDFPDLWSAALPGARCVPMADTLDLAPGAHDLILHAMGLHWANDPIGQIVQCRRALRPDGLFLSVAFGGATLSELRDALTRAEVALTGGLSPRVAPMAEIRDMGALLQRAGLSLPVADSLRKTVTYPDALALMRDLRAMGETNALAERHRTPPPRALFQTTDQIYRETYPAEENRIRASFELVFLTGWAPDESQPKPLRPGSARQSLASALGTVEFDEDAAVVQTRRDNPES